MNDLQIALSHQERAQPDDRIYVRVASQISLNVFGDNIFREVQERVLKWVFDPKRNVRGATDEAWDGNSFEIDSDQSEHVTAIALTEPRYWALRISERLKDPGRIWTTEVGIGQVSENEIAFGCRLLCSERGQPTETPRSIPQFVRGIVFTQEAFLDHREQGAEPWVIQDRDEAELLVAFLQTGHRKHPVVVFSLPEGSENLDETIIPLRTFIRRTAGYVHSVIVTSTASYCLSDIVGKDFSVYRQAVRTFYPHFNPNQDRTSDHPVATAERIRLWPEESEQSFEDFLVQQSLRLVRPRKDLEKDHPPFQQIKRFAAERARSVARSEGQSDAELLALAEEEIHAAKKEAEDTLDLLTLAEQEREDALAKARDIQASYMALQVHVDHLQKRLSNADARSVPIPASLADLEEWARENLSGYVEIHERALKAARDSDFGNVDLAYKTLMVMRDYYVPMRREGGIEFVKAFGAEIAKLGLENTRCFAQKNKARNYGGAYFVKYQGETRELDMHLKGSNNRDGRLGFRLYYFWDDETSRVVVGYLPGHLKTDIT